MAELTGPVKLKTTPRDGARTLTVSYRRGRPTAAYLYLARRDGDASARCEDRPGGIVVDFAADGRPVCVELVDPSGVTLAQVNAVLAELALEPATEADLAPLATSEPCS